MNGRHTEWFGPDFARGPFVSGNMETTAIQIATALAQLRAPVDRSATALETHADFIRSLAERIAPDMASYVSLGLVTEVGKVTTTFRMNFPSRTLLRVWLADTVGGPETTLAPDTVTWNTGTVIEQITAKQHYLVATDNAGIASAVVENNFAATWFWGIARGSRVFYSAPLNL
jgi:hypothetical protein